MKNQSETSSSEIPFKLKPMRGFQYFLGQQKRKFARLVAIILISILIGHFGAIWAEKKWHDAIFPPSQTTVDSIEGASLPTQQNDENSIGAQLATLKNQLGDKIKQGFTDVSEKNETLMKMKKLVEIYDQLQNALAQIFYWIFFSIITFVAFEILNHIVPACVNTAQQENIEMMAKRIEMLEEILSKKI